jgi:hypothetical protein
MRMLCVILKVGDSAPHVDTKPRSAGLAVPKCGVNVGRQQPSFSSILSLPEAYPL